MPHTQIVPRTQRSWNVVEEPVYLVWSPPLDKNNWSLVHMPPFEPVIHDRENSEEPEHYQGLIERCNIHWASIRPKTPEKRMRWVSQISDIDEHSSSTQTSLGVRQQLQMVNSTQEHTADWDHVNEHKRSEVEGDDSVESDVEADVDECKQADADTRKDNDVNEKLSFEVHVSEELAEWQTVIADKWSGLMQCKDVERDSINKEHD